MNRRLVFLSAFAAVFMISIMAYGQRQGQRRGRGMMGRGISTTMLLRSEAVRKEIGVTEEQATKLRELLGSNRKGFGNFRDMSKEEREKALAKRSKKAAEQKKKIVEILDAKQMERLTEIGIQLMGSSAIMDKDIAKKLDISEEQREKIAKARGGMMKKMREAMSGGDRPDREAMTKMRDDFATAIKEVLTAEQTAKLEKMKGKPFDRSLLRGGRRGN